MKRKYECVYILKLQGQEDGVDDIIGTISKELEGEGATLEQIDRLGKQTFAHENYDKQKHGYYVHYHFEADPAIISPLQAKLTLNHDVMLQHYRRKN